MNQPNLVCPFPDCGHQLTHYEFRSMVRDSYGEFATDFQRPQCTEDVFPEDALLEYHRQVGYEKSAVHPFSIGGYCNLGSTELTPGHSTSQSVLQGITATALHDGGETGQSTYETPTDIEAAQLFDADDVDAAPPLTIHDIDGQSATTVPSVV